MGLAASAVTPADVGRHYRRYREVVKLMEKNIEGMAKGVEIADIGCGSGYGTNVLRMAFGDCVYGIEPNDTAREYAKKHFPECQFYDYLENYPEICIFVESAEHMTNCEFRNYVKDAQVVVLTVPLIEKQNNDWHITPFVEKDDVRGYLHRAGFKPLVERVEKDIVFTTGDSGDQYYGFYTSVHA
jgi:hypothetical protein